MWGSNPFVKYSHLKPICINKGSFLKECTHSKKIRFHLETHTTPNFSSCSQAVWNRIISQCPIAVLKHVFPIVCSIQQSCIRISLSTSVSASTSGIKARCCQAPTFALLWFQRKDACLLSRGNMWNAPVRSLMMKQSGFPVFLTHVLHLSVDMGSVKESLHLHPVWNQHFGDG